jgi:hypothetical protein
VRLCSLAPAGALHTCRSHRPAAPPPRRPTRPAAPTRPARRRAHLAQDFAGLAGGPGAPLRQRSYLGHVLPESLLHCLEGRPDGAAAFAVALCGA